MRRAAFHLPHVRLAAVEGVRVTPADLERIAAKIAHHTKVMAPGRFASITTEAATAAPAAAAATDAAATPAAAGDELDAMVLITRYDPGSAAARLFMAGLGQAHVGGRLDLAKRATGRPLGSHEVTKTFAWGGIYGAATGIQDVEEGFAEAVAELVTGRPGS